MSLRVLSQVWDRYPQGGSKLLALLALADWANDDGGRLYPSVKALAYKIRMSERQAKRILEELIATDFLALTTPENRGGRAQSNRYQIRLETLSKCPSLRDPTLSPLSVNSDIAMSVNSDIAMSDEPLLTVNKPLPAPPVDNSTGSRPAPADPELRRLNEKIDAQRQFIKTLPGYKAGDEIIAEAERVLSEMVAERDGFQQSLFDTGE